MPVMTRRQRQRWWPVCPASLTCRFEHGGKASEELRWPRPAVQAPATRPRCGGGHRSMPGGGAIPQPGPSARECCDTASCSQTCLSNWQAPNCGAPTARKRTCQSTALEAARALVRCFAVSVRSLEGRTWACTPLWRDRALGPARAARRAGRAFMDWMRAGYRAGCCAKAAGR